jgi:predicted transcriptional regulator YdeE
VVGIQARTNNAKEATAEAIIGRQWHTFIDELMNKYPARTDRISTRFTPNTPAITMVITLSWSERR